MAHHAARLAEERRRPEPAPPEDRAVLLAGGTKLTPEEAAEALNAAMRLIQGIGTVAANDNPRAASAWMERYYPNWA